MRTGSNIGMAKNRLLVLALCLPLLLPLVYYALSNILQQADPTLLPERQLGKHAMWIHRPWLEDIVRGGEYTTLARHIERYAISDVFIRVSDPDEATGRPDSDSTTIAFLQGMDRRLPLLRMYAWRDMKRSTSMDETAPAQLDEQLLADCRSYLQAGFAGIHLEAGGVKPVDRRFLALLRRIRSMAASRGAILSLGAMEPEPLPGADWTLRTFGCPPLYWTYSDLQRAAKCVDQLVVAIRSGTGRPNSLYRSYVKRQSELLLSLSAHGSKVFVGFVPEDTTRIGMRSSTDAIRIGLEGLGQGIGSSDARQLCDVGVALDAHWHRDSADWHVFEELWLNSRVEPPEHREWGLPGKATPAPTDAADGGAMLLIGGGALGDDSIMRRFIELAGGKDQAIVIIPTALEGEFFREGWPELRMFTAIGAANLTVLHTRDRELANRADFTAPLRSARGVFITGGRQWRLADAYLGTLVQEELRNLLRRGGVIAGTSAGATILGSYLVRGDSRSNRFMMGDHEEGFGFLANTAIDQHVLARGRLDDMIPVIHSYPQLLGIGIDERTALLVRGDLCEVIGESLVAVYDFKRWCTFPERYFFLAPGDRFDIKQRRRVFD